MSQKQSTNTWHSKIGLVFSYDSFFDFLFLHSLLWDTNMIPLFNHWYEYTMALNISLDGLKLKSLAK